jgi:SAM-dependent methyltransferase
MTKLADPGHWSSLYEEETRRRTRGKTALRRAIGRRLSRLKPYDEFVLWNVLYRRYLPDGHRKTAIEVGSAPGDHLVNLHLRLGYDPFGVEYTSAGAALNRRTFELAGIDPAHVIEADLFDESFQRQYRERFDLIVSRGFIEHFSDPTEAARIHWSLLKPGGTLACSVPNLRGFNYHLTRLINDEVLAIHNLRIMDPRELSRLFESLGAQTSFCGYYGVLNFQVTHARRGSAWRHLMSGLSVVQLLLNLSFRTAFAGKGGDSATFSPHLLYVGRKRLAH